MQFLEKDLERIIHESPQASIRQRGLSFYRHDVVYRQLNLAPYGIADLVGIKFCDKSAYTKERYVEITIYELKQKTIDANTLMQACSYARAINQISKILSEEYNCTCIVLRFEIVMIGREIQKSGNFVFLLDFIDNVSAYTYRYDFDGLRFTESSGYTIIDSEIALKKNLCKWIHIIKQVMQSRIDRIKRSTDDNISF